VNFQVQELVDTRLQLQRVEERYSASQAEHDKEKVQYALMLEQALSELKHKDKAVRELEEILWKCSSEVLSFHQEDVTAGLSRLMGRADLQSMSFERLCSLENILDSCIIHVRKTKEASQMLCCICLEETKSILFLPCKHICACKTCALTVDRCPLDQIKIDQRIETFM